MEGEQTTEEFSKAFEAWKKSPAGATETANLNKAITAALTNGIDLALKIPKSVLDKTATTRPISRQDAIEFSTETEGDVIVFDVPSETNRHKIQRGKRFELVAEIYRGNPALLIKSPTAGTFGVFYADEIAALEPR